MAGMPLAVSVIVPTFKRQDLLARCLDHLAPSLQTLSSTSYEVIVTDDSGQLKALVQNHYPWAKWVQGPGKGPASNRNFGASQATGEWLAFIDDDCMADANWLKAIVKTAGDAAVDVIEGRTEIPDKVDSPFKQGVENLHGGCFWSCNLSIRRQVFHDLGGFDSDFHEAGGEDMEFAWRIKQKNLQTRYVPEALVLHPVRALGLKAILWRTFLIRWLLLYHLKTQPEINLNDHILLVWPKVAWERGVSLLRDSWQVFSKFDAQSWKSRFFWQLWNIITFPLVLPYLLYWEWKFRKLLSAKKQARA